METVSNLDVYVNSSNRDALCALECDLPTNLITVTKVSIELVSGPVIDSDKFPRCFVWRYLDPKKCVIDLFLGREDLGIENGVYNCDLFLHDEVHYQGAWFGKLRLFLYNRQGD